MDGDTTVMTDEFVPYRTIARRTGRKHQTADHSAKEYARGENQVNACEGVFSLLTRGINGVYHHVGRGHVNRYCDEVSFRSNNRGVSDGERASPNLSMVDVACGDEVTQSDGEAGAYKERPARKRAGKGQR